MIPIIDCSIIFQLQNHLAFFSISSSKIPFSDVLLFLPSYVILFSMLWFHVMQGLSSWFTCCHLGSFLPSSGRCAWRKQPSLLFCQYFCIYVSQCSGSMSCEDCLLVQPLTPMAFQIVLVEEAAWRMPKSLLFFLSLEIQFLTWSILDLMRNCRSID